MKWCLGKIWESLSKMYIVKSPVQRLEMSVWEAAQPEGEEKQQWFNSLLQALYCCLWHRSSWIKLPSEQTSHAAWGVLKGEEIKTWSCPTPLCLAKGNIALLVWCTKCLQAQRKNFPGSLLQGQQACHAIHGCGFAELSRQGCI